MRTPRLTPVRVALLVLVSPLLLFGAATVIVLVADWWYRPSTSSLRRAVRTADHVVVKNWGGFNLRAGEPLFEERDADRIAAVVNGIEIDPISNGKCMCSGDPRIEFYRGETMLAVLSVHHGDRVRWNEQWRVDGELTPASRVWIRGWLLSHGIDPAKPPLGWAEPEP